MVFAPRKFLRNALVIGSTLVLCANFRGSTQDGFPNRAFLVKWPQGYSLVFVKSSVEVSSESFPTLQAAMSSAESRRYHLRSLRPAEGVLQDVSFDPQGSPSVLRWRLKGESEDFRFTFRSAADARFYRQALFNGAYSRSPHGHALLLIRNAE